MHTKAVFQGAKGLTRIGWKVAAMASGAVFAAVILLKALGAMGIHLEPAPPAPVSQQTPGGAP